MSRRNPTHRGPAPGGPGRPGARRPEILAPAGDADCLSAALHAGADAVYFGLQEGFNARARAGNFALENLPETVAQIHRAGARAYLALNTLIFEPELAAVRRGVRRAAQAGVDALLVQDPAVALIARAVAPALTIHASTQMTISSPDAAAFARELGASRVVLPRELSVDEIRRFMAGTDLEVEVFVHGALCVAWSGQCLTSEAWGGRSANRGQCAQSCRMPYDLIVDGEIRPLGDVKYLLSPKDLAGLRAVPELVELGVHGLKIEGRQKGAQYVATATAGYKRWVDAIASGNTRDAQAQQQLNRDLLDMAVSYSRGFGDGFLGGSDHQTLVEGRFPKHRGVYLGVVARVSGDGVIVEPDPAGRPWTGGLGVEPARQPAVRAAGPQGEPMSPLPALGGARGGPRGGAGNAARDAARDTMRDAARHAASDPLPTRLDVRAGMGVVFDDGRPQEKDEPGGPIFRVGRDGERWVLGFGRPGPDLRRVRPGQRVWVTSDPALARATQQLIETGEPTGRIALSLTVEGRSGAPLRITAHAAGHSASVQTHTPAEPAQQQGLTVELLRDKLGALGGTPFGLQEIDASRLAPYLHVPVSELKGARRELVQELTAAIERGPADSGAAAGARAGVRASTAVVVSLPVAPDAPPVSEPHADATAALGARAEVAPAGWPAVAPLLLPLCRTEQQLEAVIAAGLAEVELDWMEMVGLATAVERARQAGLRVTVATLRVQKPGEESFDTRIARLEPDGVLVRHWGAVVWFARHAAERERFGVHGDFSLNVTNSITATYLLERGLHTLTASHDLDESQLIALLDQAPADRFTVVVHHRIPTFHTEHCVYSHLLSNGRDYRTCGRPCEQHQIGLRDHLQRTHPVIVDVGCRNTVFNSEVQSAAALVPRLLARGVRRFRVEFVRESQAEAAAVLGAYGELLAGRRSPEWLVQKLGVKAQQGVADRPMELLL